jgi:iron complex outermembrane receptor protein
MKTLRQGVTALALASLMLLGQAAAQDAPQEWWKEDGGESQVAQAPDETAEPAAVGQEPGEPAPAPAPESEPPSTEAAAAAAGEAELAVVTLPEQAPAPEADTQFDVVEVTAQKRVQSLVDVPINVNTLDRDDIQKVRIEQVRDVMGYVPNVDIKEQVPGAIPVVTIRGVGLDDFSSTNSPAAGIYVDGVPLTSLALMSFDLYDMERLEVLKGPQGTLYGRNSNAGAINVLTARPNLGATEGYVRAGYGSYQAKDLEGAYNLPLGDTFAVRLAAKWIQQDEGLWNSRTGEAEPYNGDNSTYTSDRPVVRTVGARDIQLARARVAWEPLSHLALDFKVDYLKQRSEMGQPEFWGASCAPGSQPIDPDNCSDLSNGGQGNGYKDTDRDPYTGDWRGEFPYHVDQLAETLTVDYDFGWATLTSVTGHIDFERYFHIDVDGTPSEQFEFFQSDTVEQLTQELRLGGDTDFGYWLAGLFASADTATVDTPGRHGDLLPAQTSQILANQDTDGRGVFGNMDWKLGTLWSALDRFTLTTGLRWSHETRAYVGGTTWAYEVCFAPGACVIENTHEDSSIEDSSVSWKAGLNFKPTAATLIYAHASEGTKSGGYFSGVTTNARQLEPYLPEELTAYEIGAKLAGAIALNASVFQYDYKNLQTFMRDGTAPVQFVGNIPEAEIRGADFDATLRVLDGLMVIAGVGLLESTLGAFVGPDGPDADSDPDQHPAGNRAANAPEFTWNLLARYELPLFETGLGIALQADAKYADEMYKEATNDPLIKSEPYTIYNARASLLDMGRTWEFALWGRNLTDELYVVQGVDIAFFGMGNRNYNAPTTYGAELIWRFQ